jgi:hypothetical protein
MLRRTEKSVMVSKAQIKFIRSSFPQRGPVGRRILSRRDSFGTKNEGFAQDDHRFCAASNHVSIKNGILRNIS